MSPWRMPASGLPRTPDFTKAASGFGEGNAKGLICRGSGESLSDAGMTPVFN